MTVTECLTTTGCRATWFACGDGSVLLAVHAHTDGAQVRLETDLHLAASKATRLDWRTGETGSVAAEIEGGQLRVRGLPEGLSLVVVPGHRE